MTTDANQRKKKRPILIQWDSMHEPMDCGRTVDEFKSWRYEGDVITEYLEDENGNLIKVK